MSITELGDLPQWPRITVLQAGLFDLSRSHACGCGSPTTMPDPLLLSASL